MRHVVCSEREEKALMKIYVLRTSTFEQYHAPVYEGSLSPQSFIDNEKPVEPGNYDERCSWQQYLIYGAFC